ncbi:gamma-glutamylcyclotransferase (plasmid) [Mesorhizobium sp. AR07]|uniref:gamma-glutamylcyclotransferase family protein n=1 Tax=Mesorhizobium sp. AR07 TaxID=2865838 RepID=UPI00220D6016|nr:gamma-glutamylcyclotransferase [Mesorhizobium sp. AR07]
MLYFAYGSNMDPEQMRERCPNAEVMGIALLQEHALCFSRLSRNRNCGVSSIERHAGDHTWGVVYRLSSDDIVQLDKSEGFRADRRPDENAYNRMEVIVTLMLQPKCRLTSQRRRMAPQCRTRPI